VSCWSAKQSDCQVIALLLLDLVQVPSPPSSYLWCSKYPHGLLVLSGFSGRLVLWIERQFLDRNVRRKWQGAGGSTFIAHISLPRAYLARNTTKPCWKRRRRNGSGNQEAMPQCQHGGTVGALVYTNYEWLWLAVCQVMLTFPTSGCYMC
jgi:hypothetical protein